jgi:ion channel-forming bestrophin family protein
MKTRKPGASKFLLVFRDVFAPLAFSKTLLHVSGMALLIGLYSCLPVWKKEASSFSNFGDIPSQIHGAMSLTLGLLLVFRTNSAYARWWEARTLWGTLVNASRNLALKLTAFVSLQNDDVDFLRARICDFPVALMNHLRMAPTSNLDSRADGGSSNHDHLPASIVQELYGWLAEKKRTRKLDGDELRILDVEVGKFMEVCGACERIARTPIVRSYRVFSRQCILLFLLTLPWGIIADFGWWTIPLTTITAYFMIGMEVVAEHVEEPFGGDEDDLDLEGICNTIERSVDAILAIKAPDSFPAKDSPNIC